MKYKGRKNASPFRFASPDPARKKIITVIHKIQGNIFTLDGNGANIVDSTGSASTRAYSTYVSLDLLFDGTDWLII